MGRHGKGRWQILYYWINTVWVWSSIVYTAGFDFNTSLQTTSTFRSKQVRACWASGTRDGQGWSEDSAPAAASALHFAFCTLSLPGCGFKCIFNSSLGDSNVGLWLRTVLKINASRPDGYGLVGWASSRKAKGCRCDSWSGHMSRLWVWSPVGAGIRGNW